MLHPYRDHIPASAEAFIRSNWAGGIGDPDVSLPEIFDAIEEIWRAQDEGKASCPWQKCATLEVEDSHVLWISGSGHGGLLWVGDRCYGLDAGASGDLSSAVDGVLKLPSIPYVSLVPVVAKVLLDILVPDHIVSMLDSVKPHFDPLQHKPVEALERF